MFPIQSRVRHIDPSLETHQWHGTVVAHPWGLPDHVDIVWDELLPGTHRSLRSATGKSYIQNGGLQRYPLRLLELIPPDQDPDFVWSIAQVKKLGYCLPAENPVAPPDKKRRTPNKALPLFQDDYGNHN